MNPANNWLGLPVLHAVGLTLLLALTAYVLTAGADFGGGIWDLLANGPRRDKQREVIAHAIGPIWEANHVWLIFVVVIMFTAFPPAFGALSIALFIPFHLLLGGIVLRGGAFIFRSHEEVASPRWRRWAAIFGAASVISPFILGATLSAVSSGGIRVVNGYVTVNTALAWFSPLSLLVGALTLAICAYLAAVYLTVETQGEIQEDFRRRALGAWAVVAILPAILLILVARHSPLLWAHFASLEARVPMAIGIVLAIGSGWAMWARRYKLGRILAMAEVAILLWGWAFAQWPYIIFPDVTAANSAAPVPTLRFLLNTLPYGFAILIPSLIFLFAVFKGKEPLHPSA
ncbi:MAG: cytochrome bd quinol oxidase subunit 2 apoprotein [Firmicutes bacterium]|nr:cytochrome bd quinol oxidase subunit 2 apoprotein [Bacillota bacterium]